MSQLAVYPARQAPSIANRMYRMKTRARTRAATATAEYRLIAAPGNHEREGSAEAHSLVHQSADEGKRRVAVQVHGGAHHGGEDD